MKDRFGRTINYLRISITDLCNLRCVYCMPPDGVVKRKQGHSISFEAIERAVQAAVGLGIAKIRLTGGEPLVRKGIVSLVEKLASIEGVEDLAMTTNGLLLGTYAKELKEAGLTRVNISLDTFSPEKFANITRGGDISQVMQGIEAALSCGFHPLKINTVVMKGFNEDELLDFAKLTMEYPIDVRFIEYMPIGCASEEMPYGFVPKQEMKKKMEGLIPAFEKGSVAQYYRFAEGKGKVGFISAMSDHFCAQCNKIRLTSDGKLKPCLHSNLEIDMMDVLNHGTAEQIQRTLEWGIMNKIEKHELNHGASPIKRGMNRIGG